MKLRKFKVKLLILAAILVFCPQLSECCSSNGGKGESTQDIGQDDVVRDGENPESVEVNDDSDDEIDRKSVKCDNDDDICAELSPGEHCEDPEKRCKCDNNPSCIGTDKPLCHNGKCTGMNCINFCGITEFSIFFWLGSTSNFHHFLLYL